MKEEKKRGKVMFIFICILVFFISFGIGISSKIKIQPSWTKKYSVKWNDNLGNLIKDIPYGEGKQTNLIYICLKII